MSVTFKSCDNVKTRVRPYYGYFHEVKRLVLFTKHDIKDVSVCISCGGYPREAGTIVNINEGDYKEVKNFSLEVSE